LAFLQSFASVVPSRLPRHPAPLLDFFFPSTQIRFEDPPHRRSSTPAFVPSSGFDYPLDGLLPSNPSEPCFMLAAPLGFAPSKLDLHAKCCNVTTALGPHAVSPASDASVRGPGYGDAGRGFWVLHLAGGTGASRLTPLGFSSLGSSRSLILIFPSEDLLSCA
jgi:hypothetical protein